MKKIIKMDFWFYHWAFNGSNNIVTQKDFLNVFGKNEIRIYNYQMGILQYYILTYIHLYIHTLTYIYVYTSTKSGKT